MKARITLVALLFAGLVNCGKSVPVQEMAAAHQEIAFAEEEHAQEFAASSVENAKQALLDSHKKLTDEAYDESRTRAVESYNLARAARMDAAPKFTEQTRVTAETKIKSAEDLYAEELAKDDFAAARTLYSEGQALQTQAQSGGASSASLNTYRQAYRKYQSSADAAGKAHSTALAQKENMMQSLAAVRGMVEKAEKYGAAEHAPEELSAAKSNLETASTDLGANRIKSGAEALKVAEEKAGLALSKSIQQYAARRRDEATVAVGQAEKNVAALPAGKEETRTLRDYAGAARESLDSAVTNYGNEQYENSIKDSDEAIRLASIIREQYLAMRGEATDRNLGAELPAGWQLYTVQRSKPEDCLSCIAGRQNVYSNIRLWRRIYEANRDVIKNPNLIFPGQKLFVPPKTGPINPPKREEEVKESVETKQPAPQTETQPQPQENKDGEKQPQENMN
jgi:nucleoid-associated protein YgaU